MVGPVSVVADARDGLAPVVYSATVSPERAEPSSVAVIVAVKVSRVAVAVSEVVALMVKLWFWMVEKSVPPEVYTHFAQL